MGVASLRSTIHNKDVNFMTKRNRIISVNIF